MKTGRAPTPEEKERTMGQQPRHDKFHKPVIVNKERTVDDIRENTFGILPEGCIHVQPKPRCP